MKTLQEQFTKTFVPPMKTFKEIFDDVYLEDLVTENVTKVPTEERAAKEYAKQWIDKAKKEAVAYLGYDDKGNDDVPRVAGGSFDKIKREIDEH